MPAERRLPVLEGKELDARPDVLVARAAARQSGVLRARIDVPVVDQRPALDSGGR
jgi:hypothetical protein